MFDTQSFSDGEYLIMTKGKRDNIWKITIVICNIGSYIIEDVSIHVRVCGFVTDVD